VRLGPTTRAVAAAIAAAAAYTAACPPYHLPQAAWLIPALLLVPCRGLRPARAVAAALVFTLLMGLGVCGWAYHASLEYFDFSRVAAGAFVVGVWLVYGGIPFALLLGCWARFARRIPPAARAPVAALGWVVMEVLRSTIFTGMPWELLSHTQYRSLWLVQIADLGGAYAVSFVLALASVAVGELVADLVADRGEVRAREVARRVAPAAAALAFAVGYGRVAAARFADVPAPADATRALAIVQGNVPNEFRWQRQHMERTLATYVGLTETTRKEHPDLVIWPENAVDFYLEREPMLRQMMLGAAALAPGGLLVGSPRLVAADEARNSAQLLRADGAVIAHYDKQRLVPFAESTVLPARTAEAAEPTYRPGARAEPLATAAGRLGTMICYEVVFPRLVRNLVRDGAQVLVNVSNDSWLDTGDGAAPDQHFAMAAFRAIETRRDLVRVAGGGASGFIDAYGRRGPTVPRATAGALVGRVQLRDGLTPYVRFGDAWIAALGVALAVVLRPWRGRAGADA
jgi:apolipoprotein N-acyltransferase